MAPAEQLSAILELLKRTVMWSTKLAPITGAFPIGAAGRRPTVDLRTGSYYVLGFQLDLLEISNCPPTLFEAGTLPQGTDLNDLVASVAPLTVKAARRLRALAESISMEDLAASSQKRPWTWTGAEAMFNAHVVAGMPSVAVCGWDELIEGRYMHELDSQMHELIQTAIGLLKLPPRRDEPAVEIHRRGSAHEEHVYGSRIWCAICGWIDLIAAPTETNRFYHRNFLSGWEPRTVPKN